jgi:cysteine-rich repeat protein
MLTCTSLSTIALALVIAACGSSAGDSQPDAATTLPDAAVITGVGTSCASGCAGADICANPSTDCEHGYCLFDGRDDSFDSYCTKDCTTTGCPAGYHCESIEFDLTRACVADVASCGNGVVERGETCDDGNTASSDGCRADCRATDTPLGDQRRIRTTATVSGSYVPKDGSATPFSAITSVDGELNASNDCGTGGDIAAGSSSSGVWRRFSAHGCANQLEAYTMFTVPYAVGTISPSSLCVALQLPPPDNARLTYCTRASSGQLVVQTASTTATGTNLTGTFQGTLALVPNQAIGGCDGLYAPSSCPATAPATISLAGTFELANAP